MFILQPIYTQLVQFFKKHYQLCFLLLFLFLSSNCSSKSIDYKHKLIQFDQTYTKNLKTQGWDKSESKDESALFYVNANYTSFIYIYLDQIQIIKKDINWKEITNNYLKELSKASKLQIKTQSFEWQNIRETKV